MRINFRDPAVLYRNNSSFPTTHEGAPAAIVGAFDTLKRTVMACMLFEDNFYESGIKASDRIAQLCSQVTCLEIMTLALMAQEDYHLRHVPLKLIVEALKHKKKCEKMSYIISRIITRPDQITDLLALYWKDGKKPLAHQLKKGIADAFRKFDAYQLGKYNRNNPIKLRDALFLCHAKPKDDYQASIWKKLAENTLESPDTWEVRLSAGEDKKESFEELLKKQKMGKLAILRNLRNMKDARISKDLVAAELMRNMKEMLPFQYIAAAREVPEWEDIVDPPMIAACSMKPKIAGRTLVFVDVSASMDAPISSKSKMLRTDAACGMAILLRECLDQFQIFSFSNQLARIPPRSGMALRDAIVLSQGHGGTETGAAVQQVINQKIEYDRLIIITDEQSSTPLPRMPSNTRNYILNISTYQNGIGSQNDWITISGFSEASIDFIRELEKEGV